MNAESIIKEFSDKKGVTKDDVIIILRNNAIRKGLYDLFGVSPDCFFAQSFLLRLIELRSYDPWKEGFEAKYAIGINDLVFAAYLVALCRQVEDSLLIWKAKTVDFDTFCGFDIQMVVYSGVEKTLSFMKGIKTEDVSEAIKYINDCNEAGDFDKLNQYFSPDNLPWYILESD